MQGVLIIHNSFGEKSDPLYASRAAVMDQVDAVAEAMDVAGMDYDVAEFDNLRQLSRFLINCQYDIIFNLAEEFTHSLQEACYVPALCRSFGKAFTGNDSPTLINCQNKVYSKAILAAAGVNTAEGVIINDADEFNADTLGPGKYLIKPAMCDASEGINMNSVVELPSQATSAKKLISSLLNRFDSAVIVERYLDGREFNVSLLQRGDAVEIVAAAEIDFSAFSGELPRIVDYDAKWNPESFAYNNTPRVLGGDIDPHTLSCIERMSLSAWKALGCLDYARVDIRTDEQGQPFVLEVNPNPDISPDGGFAAALDFANIAYEEFVSVVLENARNRLIHKGKA